MAQFLKGLGALYAFVFAVVVALPLSIASVIAAVTVAGPWVILTVLVAVIIWPVWRDRRVTLDCLRPGGAERFGSSARGQ